MKKQIMDKVKYLTNHFTGKKSVVVILGIGLIVANKAYELGLTTEDIVTIESMLLVLIGAWSIEKVKAVK